MDWCTRLVDNLRGRLEYRCRPTRNGFRPNLGLSRPLPYFLGRLRGGQFIGPKLS